MDEKERIIIIRDDGRSTGRETVGGGEGGGKPLDVSLTYCR